MKRRDDVIILSKEQKLNATTKIKEYITENFDIEIGNLQAEIFLDFILNILGVISFIFTPTIMNPQAS